MHLFLLAALLASGAGMKYAPITKELLQMIEEDLARSGLAEDRAGQEGNTEMFTGSEEDLNGYEVVEGDMLEIPSEDGVEGNAFRDTYARWGKNGNQVEVPYVFARNFPYVNVVRQAFEEYRRNTCIRFVRRRYGQKDHIKIIKGKGCYSMVGRTRQGQQVLSIGRGCQYKGIVMHELMHAMGFLHEQSRSDRDQHVQINWWNIPKGRENNNFQSYNQRVITHLGEGYDTCSIMHYGAYAFANNRNYPTILVVKNDNGCEIGQREGFSNTDIRKLNKLYGCGSSSYGEEKTAVKAMKDPKCNGGDDNCCKPDNKCPIRQGDCDCNADCRAGLVCGSNNCPGRTLLGFGGGFDLTDDCCCMPNVAVEQGGCGLGVKVEEDETCKK